MNPEKCVFGIPSGKLLGFIVSNRGIEANPTKIRALSQLAIPTNLKHIQKLAGCVAALSRFISRLGEKELPPYRLLRHTEHFEWMDAATAGLEEKDIPELQQKTYNLIASELLNDGEQAAAEAIVVWKKLKKLI